MADERTDLIARLRTAYKTLSLCQGLSVGYGTFGEAAALLERDGARIAELEAERDEARAALAEAQRDAERINWLESRAYRVDVRVKKSGNRLWVVNPPACTEYELSKSLREAIDAAIAKG